MNYPHINDDLLLALGNETLVYLDERDAGNSYVIRYAPSVRDGEQLPLHFEKHSKGNDYQVVHENNILVALDSQNIHLDRIVKRIEYRQRHSYKGYVMLTECAGVDCHYWQYLNLLLDNNKRMYKNIFSHPLALLHFIKGSLLALQSIHQCGLLHCDIRLDQICIPFTKDNDRLKLHFDEIKLIDFGIAIWRMVPVATHNPVRFTSKNAEGYRYIAKSLMKAGDYQEQHKAQHNDYDFNALTKQIDCAVDLYSFGVMLDELELLRYAEDGDIWQIFANEYQDWVRELLALSDKTMPFGYDINALPHTRYLQKVDNWINQVNQALGYTINDMMFVVKSQQVKGGTPTPTPTPEPISTGVEPVAPIHTNKPQSTPPIDSTAPIQAKHKKSKKPLWIIGGIALFIFAGFILSQQTVTTHSSTTDNSSAYTPIIISDTQVINLDSPKLPTKQNTQNFNKKFPYAEISHKDNGVVLDTLSDYMKEVSVDNINGFTINTDRDYLGISLPLEINGSDFYDRLDSEKYVIARYKYESSYHSPHIVFILDKQTNQHVSYDFHSYFSNSEIGDSRVESAFIESDVLYVSHGYISYPTEVGGITGYITAISISNLLDPKILWHSDPMVSNTKSFLIFSDHLLTGHGFTRTPDFLYILDKQTGQTKARRKVKTDPEYILQKENILYIRTYDSDYTFE